MATSTHPERTVRVKDLNRFKTKLDDAYAAASEATCRNIIDELV